MSCSYQVLSHVHGDGGHFLVVLADHFLNDIGEVVILRLLHHVEQLLHDRPDVRPDVQLGYTDTWKSTGVRNCRKALRFLTLTMGTDG